MRRGLLRSGAVVGCLAWATRILGCDPSSAAAVLKDTDGDGLSDADERALYGTSPIVADTDGDGFNDYAEVVTNVFDPLSAPLRFNPRVADVPMMEIEIASIPFVTLTLTAINGESRTIEVSQTIENSASQTAGTTQTNTDGVSEGASDTLAREDEVARQVSLQVPLDELDAGTSRPVNPARDAGAPDDNGDGDPVMVTLTNGVRTNVGVSSTAEQTRSREVSVSFTTEETRGFSQAVTQAESYSQNHELQASGANLEVLAFIRNRSNLAFQVSNLAISASVVTADGSELPIGNLDLSIQLSNFQPFSLSPGQELGPVSFFKERVTLEQAVMMLQDVRAIRLRVGVYELRDANARPYAFDVPNIRAKTASVNIDYGGLHPPEWYMVATNLDPVRPGVSLSRAISEILRIPFECNPRLGRVSVRGVGTETGDGGSATGRWCAFVRHRDEGEDKTIPYCSDVPTYDCDKIDLRAGDMVRFAWIAQ